MNSSISCSRARSAVLRKYSRSNDADNPMVSQISKSARSEQSYTDAGA
jgi:hypothetical protein